jgi:hypothetical protein
VALERCSWCGDAVDPDDGFRAQELAGERRAVFCRLEHVVPWVISGAHWDAGSAGEPLALEEAVERCSFCETPLGEAHVLLVRHRGEARIPDGFCSADHLLEWAKRGGRWAPGQLGG